jgi:PAS domain S-box-containing protein
MSEKTNPTYGDLEKRVRTLEKALEEMRLKERIPTRTELEGLVENSPDLIFRVDRNFRHLYVNRALLEVTGLSREEYVGKTNRELGMPQALCDLWDRAFSRAFENNGPQETEFTYRGTHGPRYYQLRIVPEPRPDGSVSTALGITRDITARREAEGQIRNLAKFPEENPNPVMRFTRDGTIVYANKASGTLLHTWGCGVGDQAPDEWQSFITGLAGGHKNREVRCGDRVFLLTFTPVRDATYVNLYGMDITEKKRTEEQLRETEQELRRHQQDLETIVEERTKELNCLHRLSNLIEEYDDSVEEILGRVPDLLVSASQYPEIACARVVLDDHVFTSEPFQEGPWSLSAAIMAEGRMVGTVEAGYLQKRPLRDEGPFLKEERALVNNVAHRLGKIAERNRARDRLKLQWEQFTALFDNLADSLYVADPYSYEILLVNKALEHTLGKNPVGGLCYEEFQGLDGPCDFCTNETILRERKPYTWEYHNPMTGGTYLMTDQIIQWPDGRDVRFEVSVDITERKKAEDALRTSGRRLRRLSRKLAEAQETERKYLAKELHDSIGGKLSGIKYGVEKLLKAPGYSQSSEGISLEDVISMVKETIEDSRRLSANLRPPGLDDLGIVRTIRTTCRQFEKLYAGIRTEADLKLEEEEIPDSLKIVIYRILQEALNNAAKYSNARVVRISLDRKDDGAALIIHDDGEGFSLKDVDDNGTDGMSQQGLSNMRERAELSGGEFEIFSEEGQGTTIRVVWPRLGAGVQ